VVSLITFGEFNHVSGEFNQCNVSVNAFGEFNHGLVS
jgi:hypothetical protein